MSVIISPEVLLKNKVEIRNSAIDLLLYLKRTGFRLIYWSDTNNDKEARFLESQAACLLFDKCLLLDDMEEIDGRLTKNVVKYGLDNSSNLMIDTSFLAVENTNCNKIIVPRGGYYDICLVQLLAWLMFQPPVNIDMIFRTSLNEYRKLIDSAKISQVARVSIQVKSPRVIHEEDEEREIKDIKKEQFLKSEDSRQFPQEAAATDQKEYQKKQETEKMPYPRQSEGVAKKLSYFGEGAAASSLPVQEKKSPFLPGSRERVEVGKQVERQFPPKNKRGTILEYLE